MTPRGGPLNEKYWKDFFAGCLVMLILGVAATAVIMAVIKLVVWGW